MSRASYVRRTATAGPFGLDRGLWFVWFVIAAVSFPSTGQSQPLPQTVPPTDSAGRPKGAVAAVEQLRREAQRLPSGNELALAKVEPSAAPRDPLMSLMLTQPPIDVESEVVAEAAFDPPAVRPGQPSTYRVTMNALEESVDWPAELKGPPELALRQGAHGQILAMGAGKLQPHTGFNYHARPTAPGQFTMPEFTIMVYGKPVKVPAAQLEVSESAPESVAAPHLILEFAQTNLFVGQPAKVTVLFPAANGILLLPVQQPPMQLTGEGFLIDQSSLRQHVEPQRMPGAVALAYEATLTPLAAGKLSAFAQSFVGNRFGGGGPIVISGGTVTIPGGPPQYTLLESDPVEFAARPLPLEGRLPGFTGAVGSFSLEHAQVATNVVRVGEPVKLSVRVRGDSSVARLVAPPAPAVRAWQIFANPAENLPPQAIQAQGFVTFSYTLIPLREDTRATPAIPFSFFDPQRAAYVDLSIPPVPVTVQPGTAPAGWQTLEQAGAVNPDAAKEPQLSGLASAPGLAGSLVPLQEQVWFPLLQLVPASALLGLWGWDRRRRYLEVHPNVVLRRRARRALRRQRRALRQAFQAGDARGFAAAAVGAMRVACAPHYPAEPRALVGGDVLALLPEAQRASRPGETVRRFFDVADAASFAPAAAEHQELLGLEPELARVLEGLEARL